MQPQLAQATPEINNLYAPALQQIQGQIPAIQQLYGSLIQGLQSQQGTQLANIQNSAAQRGVSGYGVTQGATDALGQALALQTGQLGAQQAQATGGLYGQLGKAQVAQGQAVSDLANSLQRQDLESQSNSQKLQGIERQGQLDQQKNQQSYDVQVARAQAAAAQAAASKAETLSQKQFENQIETGLRQVSGADKNVSPQDFKQALGLWVGKGGTPADFYTKYSTFINFQHVKDYF